MSTTTIETEAHIAARARFRQDLFSGRTLGFIARSNESADRMSYRPMLPAQEYGKVIEALGKIATMGRFYAWAVNQALPKVSPFFTQPQIIAGVANAFADIVRDGWEDVAAATGPEAGRPSDHQHQVTEDQIIVLNAILTELQFSLGNLGHVPGVGWVLRELIEERGIHFHQHQMPNVAKAVSA